MSVCRERYALLPIMVIPQGKWTEFHDPALLLFAIDTGRLNGTALLQVFFSNVGIGYTGRDRQRVAQVARAVEDLRTHKPS